MDQHFFDCPSIIRPAPDLSFLILIFLDDYCCQLSTLIFCVFLIRMNRLLSLCILLLLLSVLLTEGCHVCHSLLPLQAHKGLVKRANVVLAFSRLVEKRPSVIFGLVVAHRGLLQIHERMHPAIHNRSILRSDDDKEEEAEEKKADVSPLSSAMVSSTVSLQVDSLSDNYSQ
jgi:hypothetical protein